MAKNNTHTHTQNKKTFTFFEEVGDPNSPGKVFKGLDICAMEEALSEQTAVLSERVDGPQEQGQGGGAALEAALLQAGSILDVRLVAVVFCPVLGEDSQVDELPAPFDLINRFNRTGWLSW